MIAFPFGLSANHPHFFVIVPITLPWLSVSFLKKKSKCRCSGTAQSSPQLVGAIVMCVGSAVGTRDGTTVGETDGLCEMDGGVVGTREGSTVQGQRQQVVVQTSHAALRFPGSKVG